MPKSSSAKTEVKEAKKGRALVIVESPTKAKTISKFLGRGYTVLSSFGHVRDLPKSKIGIDVEHDFTPTYEVPETKEKRVAELRAAAEKADVIYLASDEDREGEAISWHLQTLLGDKKHTFKRITFHEITKDAITKALEHPRDINTHLVDAQQARRVLDRLVGYELSPFLWKKVTFGLSAGRVQSVIVRLIVEREMEILKFIPQEYWTVEAILALQSDASAKFPARLTRKDGETLDKFAIGTADAANALVSDLAKASWKVTSVERKTVRRSPNPPFTTSTLQQEANNRLGYPVKQTMMIAQKLYEGVDLGENGHTGLITYMRTDSVNLSDKFIEESREWLSKEYKGSIPEEPRRYKTKSKGAQEAHEAIRPTNVFITPSLAAPYLDDRQLKVYRLIWQRAVASQMVDAEMLTLAVDIDAKAASTVYGFRANGSTIVSKGFLDVYATETKETLLPEALVEGAALTEDSVLPKQHFTEPPPRFTEASLIKLLEENGIGRPSTYAPTISTVVTRQYVLRDGRKLVPTDLAMHVNKLLVTHFPDVVDVGFTAEMEEHFDEIAEGERKWAPVIRDFYGPFKKNLVAKDKEVKKADLEELANVDCDKCGRPMIFKFGRNGKFMACTGYTDKKNPCKNAKPVPGSAEAMEPIPTDEVCDCQGGGEGKNKCEHEGLCHAPMVVKHSQYGQFLGCSNYPECKHKKSILKKTGVKCPDCKEGDIVEKKSKRGKPFYACSRYPDCTTAFWSKPTGELCPTCSKPLLFAKADTVRCSDKACGFEKKVTPKEETEPAAPAETEGSEE